MISGCATKPPVDRRPPDRPMVAPVVGPPADEVIAEIDDDLLERITIEAEMGNMERALQIFEAERGQDQLLHVILLIQNRRLDEAEAILSQIIREDDSNITALYHLSFIHSLRGDVGNERKILERITMLDSNHIEASVSLGRIYARERRHGMAESIFRRVISSHGYVEDAVLGLGIVLLAQEKSLEALDQFDTIIRNNPDNMFAYTYRARIRASNDDFGGAERDLNEAIRLDPDFIWNYLDRGRARLYNGNYNAAIEDFTRVISLDSSIFIAYIHRAWAYEGVNKHDLALADYRRALELRGDYQRGFVPFALQLYRAKQYRDAAIYFIRAYDIDRSPEFLLFAAASLMRAGENGLADRLIRDNMNRIPRENLLFHIARLFVDPHYEPMVLNLLRQERDNFDRMKGNFYLALYYDIFGRNMLSEQFFAEVLDSGFIQSLEYRMASWKVQ